MYTENNSTYTNQNNGYYGNGYYDEEANSYAHNNNNKKSFIIKIIIILVCVAILVWLILILKKKNNNIAYNPNAHVENVEKVRLASEKYFFIDGNMPKANETKTVSVKTLIDKSLVSEIIDANKNVCDSNKSVSSIKEEGSVYVLRIRLSCSTDEQEEIFYYNKNTYVCQNCNGNTYMDKAVKNDDKKDDNNKQSSDSNNSSNSSNSSSNNGSYSCKEWSDWSDTKDTTSQPGLLNERTRVVVLGVKAVVGPSTITKSCTEYTKDVQSTSKGKTIPTTKKVSESKGELEVRETLEDVWVDKESTVPVAASNTIRLTGTRNVSGSTYTTCPSGYHESGNKCVSNSTTKGNLTYMEYNSGNYDIVNKPCDYMDTIKNKDGKYEYVYVGCLYHTIKNPIKHSTEGYTVYTYQEFQSQKVKYQRYCTNVEQPGQSTLEYTKDYYEEDKLPDGYSKASGTEKIQYSYMLKSCEK